MVRVHVEAPFNGTIAQSVEQRTFNPLVRGSNPRGPTIYGDVAQR
jgi:hypothetical protein